MFLLLPQGSIRVVVHLASTTDSSTALSHKAHSQQQLSDGMAPVHTVSLSMTHIRTHARAHEHKRRTMHPHTLLLVPGPLSITCLPPTLSQTRLQGAARLQEHVPGCTPHGPDGHCHPARAA